MKQHNKENTNTKKAIIALENLVLVTGNSNNAHTLIIERNTQEETWIHSKVKKDNCNASTYLEFDLMSILEKEFIGMLHTSQKTQQNLISLI